MAFDFNFNRIKDDLFEAGKAAGDVLNDTSAAAKARIEIRAKEDSLNRKYAELGKIYYEAHQDAPEIIPEGYLFADIAAERAELAELQEKVQNRQSAGSVICPVCGAKQSKDAFFCSACGSALK